jgi:hypothetical protein
VAELDTLTEEEELALIELDQKTLEAEMCVLSVGDRILHDLGEGEGEGEGGFRAGIVKRLDTAGRLCVQLDGSREEKMLARTDMLFKAPEPTTLKVKSLVRLAFTDNAIEGTTRWEYGKVVKVHNGKELLDIDLDNGQNLRFTPTFDVGVSLVE